MKQNNVPVKIQIDMNELDEIVMAELQKERKKLAKPNPNVSEEDKAFNLAEIYDNRVRLFSEKGDNNRVIVYGEMCLAELSKMQCDDYAPFASTVYLLGLAYSKTPQGEDNARNNFLKALELAKKQDDYLIAVQAAWKLDNKAEIDKSFSEGLEYYKRENDAEWLEKLISIKNNIEEKTTERMPDDKFREIFYSFLPPNGSSLEQVVGKLIDNNRLDNFLNNITEGVERGVELLSQSKVSQDQLNDVAYEYSTIYAVVLQNLEKRKECDKIISLGERHISEIAKISNDRWCPFGYAVIIIADAYKSKGQQERAKQLYEYSIEWSRNTVNNEGYTFIAIKSSKALGRQDDAIEFLFDGINHPDVETFCELFSKQELREICAWCDPSIKNILEKYLR